MKNILVVSVNWLGDVIFSTPVYKAIKDNYPAAKITALAVPRVVQVLDMCPEIDEVIVYDEDGKDRPLINKLSLVRRLAREEFDIVFILRPSLSRSFLMWMAGIPERVGFRSRGFAGLLTHAVDPDRMEAVHRADAYLQVVESYGLSVKDRTASLSLPSEFYLSAQSFLLTLGIIPGEPYVVLNTGGNWDLKQWPWENFAGLVERLTKDMKMKVVLPGSDKDVLRAKRIAERSGVQPYIIAGQTDLGQLAGILSEARLVISADSGPLHLANALGTPTVAIFGPTRPEVTGPRGQARSIVLQKDVRCNNAPCYYLECGDNRCMKKVTVDDVCEAVRQLQS